MSEADLHDGGLIKYVQYIMISNSCKYNYAFTWIQVDWQRRF